MTPQQQALWQKIQAFAIDDPAVSFSFSTRLARENGWTKKYALRVIEEYKRFIFLCCISETGVTPSDAVDQAWHLHLTFTKSYWIDFCQKTLEKEVHHNPTKGGDSEATKFDNYYSASKELYRRFFQQPPPADIWPDNDTRFSDIDFQRVNLRRFWLVKKPKFSKTAAVLSFLLLSSVLLIQASDGSLWVMGIFLLGFLAFIIWGFVRDDHGPRGCSAPGGCGSNTTSDGGSGDGHHGHSGCSSGCSGCSSSGCSGCGGGGGGD